MKYKYTKMYLNAKYTTNTFTYLCVYKKIPWNAQLEQLILYLMHFNCGLSSAEVQLKIKRSIFDWA